MPCDRKLFANRVDLNAGCAEKALTQHFDLPCPHVRLAIKLRADVVFLHAVAIDDAVPKALAGQVVGQVGTERPAPQMSDVGRPASRAARFRGKSLVMELVSHRHPLRSIRHEEN